MKILLIMDPGIPVPPALYGGHERLVYMFASEYARLGHDVSVLSGPGSKTPGKNYFFGVNDLGRSRVQKFRETIYAWLFLYRKRADFDLIHNFGRLVYLLPVLNSPVSKIMSYGRRVTAKGIRKINTLPTKNLLFTACSDYCVATGNVAGKWETVYNAVDFTKYTPTAKVDEQAPLMFLGRLDRTKGCHTAIDVALASGRRLWIGGSAPTTAQNLEYYNELLAPRFDQQQIIYLGPLNDEEKNHYLGQAAALLFPIEDFEAFGLVMAEAMACGTPVIGLNVASVPEVITQGITGFVVNTKEEMIEAIAKVQDIDRLTCRQYAQLRFDTPVVAQRYLQVALGNGA